MDTPKKVIVTGPISLSLRTALRSADCFSLTADQPHQAGPMAVDIVSAAASLSQALLLLNIPAPLIAKIGADPLGALLHSLLEKAAPGLADDLVVDPSTSTAYQLVIQPGEGDPAQVHANGTNDHFYASDLPRGALQGADLFLFCDPFGMRSVYRGEGGELVSILNKARRVGMTTALALTNPQISIQAETVDWPAVLAPSLSMVDLLLADLGALCRILGLAEGEFKGLNGANDFAARLNPILTGLMDGGPKLVLVHAARRGVYLRTAGRSAWQKGGRALAAIHPEWVGCAFWQPFEESGDGEEVASLTSTLAGVIAGLLGGETPGASLSTSVESRAT